MTAPAVRAHAVAAGAIILITVTSAANCQIVPSAGYTFNPSTGNTVTISLPSGTSASYDVLASGWPDTASPPDRMKATMAAATAACTVSFSTSWRAPANSAS